MENDFREIISYAAKAPSGHNTQPWMFKIEDDTIVITPNFEVALPVVDPDNRELYISLGCAVENLFVAAYHFGYDTFITKQDEFQIQIKLAKSGDVKDDLLLGKIEKRQTNRRVYSGDKIPQALLNQLQTIQKENHIQLYFTEIGALFANNIVDYIKRGNEIQLTDKAFKHELLSWMRFNAKQVKESDDGLSYRVFGNPQLPEILAKPIVKQFLKPNKQNRSDMAKINSSSHLVLFTLSENRVEWWIDLGRTLERFLLTAVELGISCAYLNQPCEVEILANEMRNKLPINREFPTLILRIGYAESMPYSPRKAIKQIMK